MSCLICNELLHHMCDHCNISKPFPPPWLKFLTLVYMWTTHLCILLKHILVYLGCHSITKTKEGPFHYCWGYPLATLPRLSSPLDRAGRSPAPPARKPSFSSLCAHRRCLAITPTGASKLTEPSTLDTFAGEGPYVISFARPLDDCGAAQRRRTLGATHDATIRAHGMATFPKLGTLTASKWVVGLGGDE